MAMIAVVANKFKRLMKEKREKMEKK